MSIDLCGGSLLLKVKVIQIQHRRENPRCTGQRTYRRQPIRIARLVVCAEDLRAGYPGAVGGHYNHSIILVSGCQLWKGRVHTPWRHSALEVVCNTPIASRHLGC